MPERFFQKSGLVVMSILVGILLYEQRDLAVWLRTDVLSKQEESPSAEASDAKKKEELVAAAESVLSVATGITESSEVNEASGASEATGVPAEGAGTSPDATAPSEGGSESSKGNKGTSEAASPESKADSLENTHSSTKSSNAETGTSENASKTEDAIGNPSTKKTSEPLDVPPEATPTSGASTPDAQPTFELPSTFTVTPPSNSPDSGSNSPEAPADAPPSAPVTSTDAAVPAPSAPAESPVATSPQILHPVMTDVSLFEEFDTNIHPFVQQLKNLLGLSSESEKDYYRKLTQHTINLTKVIDLQTKQTEQAIALINSTYGRTTTNACMRIQYYTYLATENACILVNEDVCSSSGITEVNHFYDQLSCERTNGVIKQSSMRDQKIFLQQQSEYLEKLAMLEQKYNYLNTVWQQLVDLARAAKDFDDLGAAGNQINTYRTQQGKEATP